MSLETHNKQVVETYHYRLWRDGDLSAIDAHWDPAAAARITGFAEDGLAAVKADVQRYWGAFDTVETRILHLLADGDSVVLHWETAGNHIGAYDDVAATGKRVTMSGIDILTLRDDRIVDCVSMWDGLSVYDQLGVLKIG